MGSVASLQVLHLPKRVYMDLVLFNMYSWTITEFKHYAGEKE